MNSESMGWKCPHCGGNQRQKHHEEIPEVCNECGLIADPDISSDITKAVSLNETNDSQNQSWTETVGITNSTEKQVALALTHLEEIAEALHLPSGIRRTTAEKYGELAVANFTDGRPTEHVVGATAYIVARDSGKAIPLARVTEVFDTPQVDLHNLARSVHAELGFSHSGCKSVDYVDFLCAELDINQEQKERAIDMLESYEKKPNQRGGNPAGTACATLYLSCNRDIPQRAFAGAGSLSQETIRMHLKSLKESGIYAQ
jgi:transcription initiation factor TFIIB